MRDRDDRGPAASDGAGQVGGPATTVTQGSDDRVRDALAWAGRGIGVFPIAVSWNDTKGRTDKRPLTDHGHLDAASGGADVHAMFADAPRRMRAGEVLGVGGLPGPAGFVVFDLDRHGGPDGVAYGADELHLPPYTYRGATGSGGEHRWLRKRDDIPVGNASPWAEHGVDVRADDGWVVLAAETPWGTWGPHPDGPPWDAGCALVPAGVWAQLVGARATSGSTRTSWRRFDPDEHLPRLHPAVPALLEQLAAEGASVLAFRERDGGEPYLDLTCDGTTVSATLGRVGPCVLNVFSAGWPGRPAGPQEVVPLVDVAAVEVVEDPVVSGQSAVAERVVRMFPGRFMFVPGIGWHVYDGRRWDQGNGAAAVQVQQAAVRAARRLIADAAQVTDAAVREDMLKLGHRTLSSSAQVAGVVDFVQLHPHVLVTADELNADPFRLNVLNGTLDLRTGHLHPHAPGDRITRVAGTEYHPDAVGERWQRFLAEALADPDLIAAVARCYGGAGLPGLVREHLLPIVHGPGGAGKGTFIETLAAALGDYAIAAEPELLLSSRAGAAHPTGTMDLLGARLAFVSETDDGRRLAAATMKRLTGGDTIRARKMRMDFVQFRPSHLLTLVTNHLPTMPAGDDPAVWRRLRVIPFTRVPAAPDKRLGEHLRDELPGVLAWLVRGHAEYVLAGDEIDWPGSVLTATSAYRGRSDLLGTFLDETTVKVPEAVAAIGTGELYAGWKAWLEDNAPDVRPGRTGDFVQKLRDRGETVQTASAKGTRTVVKGRRKVTPEDVSDVSDVSLGSSLCESTSPVHMQETPETSEPLRFRRSGAPTSRSGPDAPDAAEAVSDVSDVSPWLWSPESIGAEVAP